MRAHINKSLIIIILLCIFSGSCTSSSEQSVDVISLEELEEWDLVWITDSSGWGVAQVYADMVAEDTGKKINIQDLWEGGFEAGLMLEILQGEYDGFDMELQKLPEYIKEAEIVVFYGNPNLSIDDKRPGDWNCIDPINAHGTDCDPEIFFTYVDHLIEIYDLIHELRGGNPTIIRTYDAYYPYIDQLREKGSYEECKKCWANYNAAIHQAADASDVPVAAVAEAWNGPDWMIDPDSDRGYTRDHEHPSELGAQVIAQALRELGYDPVQP